MSPRITPLFLNHEHNTTCSGITHSKCNYLTVAPQPNGGSSFIFVVFCVCFCVFCVFFVVFCVVVFLGGGGVVVFFLIRFFIGILFTVVIAKSGYFDERDAGQ